MYVESKKGKTRELWSFHGGLHLPDHKEVSLHSPLQSVTLPKRLVVPLQQHIGVTAQACVKPGERVLKGQLIADSAAPVTAPLHAPTSGSVIEIVEHAIPHPSGLSGHCIVIEPDGEDSWVELPPPISDYRQESADTLRQRIRESGIVGMGGATFPSAIKLNPGKPIKTLIINGAECEPYITCDDRLMRDQAAKVMDGARILQHLLQSEVCLIAIEDNKPEAILAMFDELRQEENIEVVRIPTVYPSGGEKQLIHILTGQEVPTSGLPAQIGTICHNVATTAAIADAVLQGRPLVSRLVTVTGEGIKNPGNYEVPIGMLASDLIEQAGGYQNNPQQLILGGPMMGFDLSTDRVPITKGSNCILCPTAEEAPRPEPAQACIRCGRCADVCPAHLLPQQMYWHSRAKDLEKVQDYNLFDCIECGCCSHVCPSHIPLVHYFRYAKAESWALEQERRESEHAKQRHDFRIARLERLEAERKARLRKKKENLKAKPAAKKPPTKDDKESKQAAIQAAMKRAAEKKAKQSQTPKNTENLTAAQQAQIEAVDERRKTATKVRENHSEPPA
ncbi:MAG: electron transport complex subunit RsxC [Candidatus Thiodiazotropha weberae]|uniref:Ion-translocating oxidoreductase complex subunit C n=1 Tax=Candidatus Thiodiazotropha endoloripes TaxID=1818881 RepID=A0A1E2UL86_9GAMM|nr:electron transport complex subunit RsxC [Candidatus Thiodiazotropha endoloripes]MCG7898835.1 electron transport complex subunit RsxC [Candidatus Thiodiazotropha weberae]MCG7904180.1 electron transport complex subunit RsxC [Candidatus Thiodiazotropha weberae]MCG7915624.1 electron transport complex subunit RsxC [Candidatus Thiodiazotropha weberae]ODB95305.1 electron transport complex subunit RsxC [Candidatus Thiodiazotropha endoloripes]